MLIDILNSKIRMTIGITYEFIIINSCVNCVLIACYLYVIYVSIVCQLNIYRRQFQDLISNLLVKIWSIIYYKVNPKQTNKQTNKQANDNCVKD